MEKEVSSMVDLMTGIIAVSLVLGIVFVTLMIGQGITNDVVNTTTTITRGLNTGFLEDLAKGEIDNELPTATAFNILTTYDVSIGHTGCGICGEEREVLAERTCLGDHMSGKVSLETLGSDGRYVVLIHKGDCNWYVGSCTCPNKGVFTAVKQKYGF